MKHAILAMTLAAATLAASAAKVTSVRVTTADGKLDKVGDAAAHCQVRVGAEYDPQQCARDVRALRDAGDFDDIEVKAEHSAGGIDITYVVTRKMRFQGPLVVKGCDYWGEGKIAKYADLKDGYSYGESQIYAAAGRIRTEYQKKFFSDVKVTPVITPIPGISDAVQITMIIEEGERAQIDSFEFEGNTAFESADLRATFNQFPWWNPLGWFTDVPATKQDLAEARDRVIAHYRDNGYLDVDVSMPELAKNEKGKTIRVFKVTEGPRYKVGKITVTGVKAYPADVVAASVKAVSEGSFAGQAALDEAAHEVEVFCGSGRAALAETHATVRRIPSAEGEDVLDLEFVVEEGYPVTVNRVLIRGNDYTMDKVIRREIALSPGDPMLADKAERSKKRIENLRYFDRVRYYLEKTDAVPKEGEGELRDLVYELSEKNTGNFLIGIGAGSESSVFGQVELSEANFDLFSPWRFRGAGQKGRICVQAGPRVQTYEASVTEPWFLDRQLELTVEAYRRQRWFDDYDVIRNGLQASISYPVKFWPTWEAFGRVGMSIGVELIEYDDVENDIYYNEKTGTYSAMLKDEERENGDKVEVPLGVFWRLDTRDRFIFPTQGHVVKLYGDLVGGDNEYWRAGFNVRKYFPVWKKYGHVFQIGARGETLDSLGNDDVPLYNRLFLGGSKSIRGVDFREIAPRIYQLANKKGHYTAWGGQTQWCINMEYSVPVVKMLRIAAFSDLGSVGEDDFDFDTDWFCWSVGVGLRLDIEQFPIRLDFATPVVDPDEGVDEKVFTFSIGYDF